MALLSIDVGGTFTDFVALDEGRQITFKIPSTPGNPAEAVLTGIKKVKQYIELSKIERVILGTTIGTNAIIQRKGAKMAFLVTEGFADILYIGRQQRPVLYDLFVEKTPPAVTGENILEIKERILADGDVLVPLTEEEIGRVIRWLELGGYEAVAITFLHSYTNPAHEIELGEAIRKAFPAVCVSLSCEVAPEICEYERASTTVLDAYIKPAMLEHLEYLATELGKLSIPELLIMQSDGGVRRTEELRVAVSTINSGPAGGVLGGRFFGELAGFENLITLDMGGTSCDITMIRDGEFLTRPEFQVLPVGHASSEMQTGLPIKYPSIDVNCVGAGGGSIAWIDRGGLLKVGPQSAGSNPGPACYQRGGIVPTVTDAHLVLGHLDPQWFAGDYSLNPEAAQRAIYDNVARPLGLKMVEAASGIIRVVNSNMVRGIKVVSTERGLDPRDFALVVFGGAGPLHAAELACEMGMKKVVVPPDAGVVSAFGLLTSDFRYHFVTTYISHITDETLPKINRKYEELENQAQFLIQDKLVKDKSVTGIELVRSADLRYVGQGYTINVGLPASDSVENPVGAIYEAFNEVYQRLYGYNRLDQRIECVNLRLQLIARIRNVRLPEAKRIAKQDIIPKSRKVIFQNVEYDCPVLMRAKLSPGEVMRGPLMFDEHTTAVVIPPYATMVVDDYNNIIISIN